MKVPNNENVGGIPPEALAAPEVVEKPFDANESTPSNWTIVPTKHGIEARHRLTQRIFIGTIEDFNKMLRG